MEINNNYTWRCSNDNKRENSPLLPNSIRGLIVGKSNCGKTTLLLNLLLQPDWLDYNHLYVFGRSLHQYEYKILQTALEKGLSKKQISNIFENQENLSMMDPLEVINMYINQGGKVTRDIKVNFYDDCSKIPDPTEMNEREKNVIIFDDCLLEKQSKAEAYYTRGRHNNCDSVFLSQNYILLPRHTIRENANFIILFLQDAKNIVHIHADHCTDIDIKEFREFCQIVWQRGQYNFVTIDLTSTKYNGKYRENLNRFYFPRS